MSRAFPKPDGDPSSARVPNPVLAAIDVGSNSIKLLVMRAEAGGDLEILAREKTMVRLGHETLQTGLLPEAAMAAGVECLKRFAALARAAGADRILCAATCAVREAENGPEFARRAKEAADLDLEVISGEEEARLITRAVRSDFALAADPLLVIDIGGGSTEVIVSAGSQTPLAESLELGAVRLTDRFLRSDPMDPREVLALRQEVDARVKRVARAVHAAGYRTAVGTSGTIAALADLADAMEQRRAAVTGHRWLPIQSLRRVVKTLLSATARERARLPGMEARRSDIVPAGGVLLLRLMERFDIQDLAVCDRSLRDGLILDALDRTAFERDAAPSVDSEPDVRRRSVARLAGRANLELAHAAKTRDLALLLFDLTHPLHQLAGREREWLEHAAFLHDIGMSIAYARHHKHSAYLIAHGELKGFDADEIEVIAQVSRYHRKSRPTERHDSFARLDPWLKPIVEKLAALLRVADALDRTHRQVVTGVDVELRRKRLVLKLHVTGDASPELWATERKSRLFTRLFGRRVELSVDPVLGT
jgi:exopolyphosphatase/guanosine-5'-triphosphate,3'-diphosphate pyrophosphatase